MTAKRWYDLPNGARIQATPERYAQMMAQHEAAKDAPKAHEGDEDEMIAHLLLAHAG